ncbi:(Fe-S)-binding protein [Chloroflexota bacterium]
MQKGNEMDKKARELIPPGLVYIADNIIHKRNVLGARKGAGAKWAKDLNLPQEAKTIFFAGCGYQYNTALEAMTSLIRKMDKSPIGAELPMGIARFQKKMGVDFAGVYRRLAVKDSDADGEPLRDAVRVLRNLGIEFGYLADDEPCCGGLLHHVGLQSEFAQNARRVYDELKSHGVERIIGIVPSCTYTLRDLVPKYIEGYDLDVKHFLQVLLENIAPDRLRFPGEVRVVYHDPCQLSRYLGLVEEPRRILGFIKGIDLVETEWTSGEWATCCGGGGGFEAVFPELSEILAVNRARELVETGARIIVTHCPGCIMQLKGGLKKLGIGDVEVLDLAQVVAMAMEG